LNTPFKITFTLFFFLLSGCELDIFEEDKNNQDNENDISGVWSGTQQTSMSVSDSGFSSYQQSQSELYWVIRRKSDGTIEIPNCYNGYEEVEVIKKAFTYKNIDYRIINEELITASVERSGYTNISTTIEMHRKSKDMNPIGEISGTWSEYGNHTSTTPIYCANISSVSISTSNGDNFSEDSITVHNGTDYNRLSIRTGTDAHKYIKIKYNNKGMYGFERNGFEYIDIEFPGAEKPFFSFSAQEGTNTLEGRITLNEALQ
jgi:hypothetical protein